MFPQPGKSLSKFPSQLLYSTPTWSEVMEHSDEVCHGALQNHIFITKYICNVYIYLTLIKCASKRLLTWWGGGGGLSAWKTVWSCVFWTLKCWTKDHGKMYILFSSNSVEYILQEIKENSIHIPQINMKRKGTQELRDYSARQRRRRFPHCSNLPVPRQFHEIDLYIFFFLR